MKCRFCGSDDINDTGHGAWKCNKCGSGEW